MTTRCQIADDQAMVRAGFAAVLAAHQGCWEWARLLMTPKLSAWPGIYSQTSYSWMCGCRYWMGCKRLAR